MRAALSLDWRPQASKMAVLIADAPPHGIGEYGDGFPNGSPVRLRHHKDDSDADTVCDVQDGEDPLSLAREMASNGITLVSTLLCLTIEPH